MKICSWSSYFSSNNQNQLTLPCVISSDRGFELIYMKLSSEKLIILPLTCQLFCPSCIFCNFRLPGTAEKKQNNPNGAQLSCVWYFSSSLVMFAFNLFWNSAQEFSGITWRDPVTDCFLFSTTRSTLLPLCCRTCEKYFLRFWMAAGSTLSSHMDLIRYGEAVMSSWLSPLSAVVNTESYTHRDVTARCNFLLILSIHFGSNKNFYLSKSSCYTIVTSKSMH